MKNILIALIFIVTVSCNKNYSIEYFNTYCADAPNKVMSLSYDFKSLVNFTTEKKSYDIFIVSVFYLNSKNEIDTSYGQFNHNGKLLYFNQ